MDTALSTCFMFISIVKPRLEAHMDMIFLKCFEEHRLDSTTTYITTALFILQSTSKKDYDHMRLWTRFYGNSLIFVMGQNQDLKLLTTFFI